MLVLGRTATLKYLLLASSCAALGAAAPAAAQPATGTLFISSSTYAGTAKTITVGQALPVAGGAAAVADGRYPDVFRNSSVDGSFGITSPIILTALQTTTVGGGVQPGPLLFSVNVTAQTGVTTSFSSKSELSLTPSTDGSALTFVGYVAPVNTLDVSNANTPDHVDPSNTDIQTPTDRAVVEYDLSGSFKTTPAESYTGDNARAAILARNVNNSGQDSYFMAGNAGNGHGTPPTFVVNDTGVQTIAPGGGGTTQSTVIGVQQGVIGSPTGFQYGFAVGQLGYPDDKSGKDNNFRSITIFNNTLYVAKGSGGNGIDTVYQFSPPGGGLPTAATGPMTTVGILPGFPKELAANLGTHQKKHELYPFGLYFANASTLYVADEGPGDNSRDPNAGLQKWILVGSKWQLAYTLQTGLQLDETYTVAGYPAGQSPRTTGLRNIAGGVNGSKVTIFAVTSTNSRAADAGADPNKVVRIVDDLYATTLPAKETFSTVQDAAYGVIYRGAAYVPCANQSGCTLPPPVR